MRTTLNIDGRLLRAARKRAAEEGETLGSLIERSLRAYLGAASGERKEYRLRLLVKKGRPVAGVHWDDRDSIFERMDGRS